MKRSLLVAIILSAAVVAPALGQEATPRLTVEPYIGYGFFGTPSNGPQIEADVAYGGRAAYHLSSQWAVFGNYQRSTPEVQGGPLGLGTGDRNIDHWTAGVEFSFIPRGGAEGMLPILLEAGLGQVRYDWGVNDLAAKLGISSALRLTPNFGVRYGADTYLSNYRGDQGVTNQIFVRAGAELRF